MEKELEQLKAKVAIYEKAYAIVSEDLMKFEEKLATGVDGIDSKGVSELQAIINDQSRMLSIAATEISDL